MKFSLSGTLVLFLLATVPFTAPLAGEVPATNPAESTASKWWTIPYPDRFELSLLSREQAQLSISGKDFVFNIWVPICCPSIIKSFTSK